MRDGRPSVGTPQGHDRGALPLVVPAKLRIPVRDALPRQRLEGRLAEAWRYRLTLVVAPAGSGKTTLVARFAATAGVPVGWYRAEAWDADEAAFVRHLEGALRPVLPGVPGGWASVEDVARALETRAADAVLLVVDDGHALEGTPAEASLGRLVDYAPPWLAIVVAARVPPAINLPRLRVSGDLLELGQDDLRFRSWEVEQLFRDVYHDPVPPADLAALARRMEGWAAGLQLFHLATSGRSRDERRRLLTTPDARGRLLREYLAQNVLAGLPGELRRFLLDTCVLGRLSGSLCDRLRGTTGSADLLDELSRRSIFTMPVEDADEVYRYHSVLRSHLDRILVTDVGEIEARRRYARAAELLEQDGALADALVAWCRAEDSAAVERLLDRGGEHLANGAAAWLEALPPSLVRHDPWLVLATARQARAEGRWASALESYARAETGLGSAPAADECRRERLTLAAWLDPVAIAPPHWTNLLRAGLARDPAAATRDASALDDAVRPLVRGLLMLAAGEVREASRVLGDAACGEALEPSLRAAARLGAATADLLGGEVLALGSLAAAVESAELAGVPWVAALGRDLAQQAAGVDPVEDRPATGVADAQAAPGERDGSADADPWGSGLRALAHAWVASLRRPAATGEDDRARAARRSTDAEHAAAQFRRLGAAVPEAWARGLMALAHADAGAEGARDLALAVESLGRTVGVPAARLLAYRALEAGDPGQGPDFALLADGVAAETGLLMPGRETPRPLAAAAGAADDGAPGLELRLLGGFVAMAGGHELRLHGVKPRARALFRLLALHAPAPVHREVLQDALWPEADAGTGARSLQVAVSALRSHLATAGWHDPARLIERRGDTYRLAVSPDAVDLRRFETAVADARAARTRGGSSVQALRLALDLYVGDVLPEDGPAEWVVGRRDQVRLEAVDAALALAEEALASGDPSTAIHACQAGLAIDRFNDPLWRLLIVARDRAGDAGAATRDRREYAAVLAGLGVHPESAPEVLA